MGVKGKSILRRHCLVPPMLCDLNSGIALSEPFCRERTRMNFQFVSSGNR